MSKNVIAKAGRMADLALIVSNTNNSKSVKQAALTELRQLEEEIGTPLRSPVWKKRLRDASTIETVALLNRILELTDWKTGNPYLVYPANPDDLKRARDRLVKEKR